MATPDKGADAEVRPAEAEAQDTTPEEVTIPTEEQLDDGGIPVWDPRKAIYEKSDALRAAQDEEPAEEAGEAEEEAAAEPEGDKGKEAPPAQVDAQPEADDAAKVLSIEEAREFTKGVKFKLKLDGEEVEVDFDELAKGSGLQKKLNRKLMDVSAAQKAAAEQFRRAAEKPQPRAPQATDPNNAPLRYWNDGQVQGKYDELHLESPYKAQQFLRQVEQDRAIAAHETEEQRITQALYDFRQGYPEVTEADWAEMNKEEFYTKYPDITQAMARGDHYATFVAAKARYDQERFAAERAAQDKAKADAAKTAKERTDAKKKGQVLRGQAQATPQKAAPKQAEQGESRQDTIRRMMRERRETMGLGPPKL